MKVQTIIKQFEEIAPRDFAFYPDDNNGLLVGDYTKEVHKIMLALDLTEAVLDEAIEKQCGMIITHHPLIFKGIKNIRVDNTHGRILTELIKNEISVYCAHTNLDVCQLGVNEALRKKLQFPPGGILKNTHNEEYYKFVVYVPEDNARDVLEAISKVGAGHIGNYSHCSFQTMGKGTFKPLDGADPYIGAVNSLTTVHEVKLETIVPKKLLNSVLKEMEKVHPYEEIAYDLIPLDNNSKKIGLGKIIELEENMSVKELAEHVIEKLGCTGVKVFKGDSRPIKKVAICGGSGSSVIHEAKFSGCQCLITGDVDYHKGQMAVDLGLNIIDAGHYHTEVPILEELKVLLEEKLENTEVLVTKINTCPYEIITK